MDLSKTTRYVNEYILVLNEEEMGQLLGMLVPTDGDQDNLVKNLRQLWLQDEV